MTAKVLRAVGGAAFVALWAAGCGLNTAGEGPLDGGDTPTDAIDGDGTVHPDDGGPDRPDVDVRDGDAEVLDEGVEDVVEETGPVCGDGILEGAEECDDGPDNSDTVPGACRTDCRLFSCGDGVVDPGEACDDGNTTSGDGCEADCSLISCGDGIVQAGEECDDANTDDTDECLSTCVAASCGDGAVWAGHEVCDRSPAEPCDTTCASTGSRACAADCTWSTTCTPPAETCNGLDDDCDGFADNGFDCVPGTAVDCLTGCGSAGSGTCTASCRAPTGADCLSAGEVCNGVDDDCDTVADDGFACAAGALVACTTSCGSTGSGTCSGTCTVPTGSACIPPAEVCNALDDDCDTVTDDGFTCIPGVTGPCPTTCGSAGSHTCDAACAWGDCIPPAELCNGADDDCDTVADDGFACAQGTLRSCSTTCGSTGEQLCTGSCAWGSCSPPIEVCNGVDDDCALGCDNGFPCCAGTRTNCTTTCGSTGTGTCTATCAAPAAASCTPPAETCNAIDDDCNGSTDETFACVRGATRSCTASCGTTGAQSCGSACTWDACTPPAEACNAIDDDCNGSTDETFACIQGTTGTCTTSCGSTGSRLCSATCAWGACTPPAETCNGIDDDCDGAIDEGLAACNDTCANAIDITSLTTIAGTTTGATSDATVCAGPCAGGNAPDVWYRFTLAAREVVYLGVVGAATWDTVLDIRRGTACGALTAVACQDDSCSTYQSQWAGQLDAGTYYVALDGCHTADAGAFTLTFLHSPCPGATLLTGAGTSTGTTCGQANDTTTGTTICGGSGEDVAYFFPVCPGARTVRADDCEDGETWNASVYLRRGGGGICGGTALDCGGPGSCGFLSPRATTSSSVTGPDLVFAVQDGWGGACGHYHLDVSW
jgi:cysteine-rich repeat protein